ncbi:hypothetical protein PHLGIDRAFT_420152 [Phlebiopsis gigantea 11061_1 CR5-6]|uniref:Uncharacterized protein n=1 Tax=Phlebiopsis gigantea (strain 11061_1 CR5-6) TaxID=745531 RepID=A0A0C3NQI1_PHLG1|nr:hypothetical protein PHLGIDRAFT_420152 [Phlebiopsis gigantea 11061_1 CR5-6]
MSSQSIFDQVALPDPALIPARIIEGHRRENRTREGDGLIALIAYSIRVQMEPTPTDDMAFKDMLDNGLTSALITCMLDEHLCGFTKAELTSCQGGGLDLYLKNIVPYINRLLPGITALIAFLRGMYTMWCASHRFWRALWEIRTPFVDSQPRNYPDADGSPIRLQYGLHRLSAVLSSYEHAMRPGYPQPTPVVPNCRQHVMLTLWLHAEKRRDRHHSLIEAKLAVAYEEFHFGDTVWTDLYENAVADHAEGREQLLSATVRGFRAEDNIGKTMQSLLTFVCDLRPAHELEEARRKNLIPRQVLIASIAAWRTQACMNDARGVDGDEVVIYNALRLQFNYLGSFLVEQHSGPQELPERHLLGVVLLISQYIGNIMLTEDPMLFRKLSGALTVQSGARLSRVYSTNLQSHDCLPRLSAALPLPNQTVAPEPRRTRGAAVADDGDLVKHAKQAQRLPQQLLLSTWTSGVDVTSRAARGDEVHQPSPRTRWSAGTGYVRLGRVRVLLPPTDTSDACVHWVPHSRVLQRALPRKGLGEGSRQPLPGKTEDWYMNYLFQENLAL